MAYLLVAATLADYDRWKTEFDGYTPAREEHGSLGYHLMRSADDPDEVSVLIEFDTLENARRWNEYLESEGAMPDAGMSDVRTSYFELEERRRTERPVT